MCASTIDAICVTRTLKISSLTNEFNVELGDTTKRDRSPVLRCRRDEDRNSTPLTVRRVVRCKAPPTLFSQLALHRERPRHYGRTHRYCVRCLPADLDTSSIHRDRAVRRFVALSPKIQLTFVRRYGTRLNVLSAVVHSTSGIPQVFRITPPLTASCPRV